MRSKSSKIVPVSMGAGLVPQGSMSPKSQLHIANNNLRQQVASGGITRDARLAEMQRLRGLPPDQIAAGNAAAAPHIAPPQPGQDIDPGYFGHSGGNPDPGMAGGSGIKQPMASPYQMDPGMMQKLQMALMQRSPMAQQMSPNQPSMGLGGAQQQPNMGFAGGLQPQLNQPPKPFGM